ncbi:MAG TPA: dihydropteroate synthase [Candidatus Nitrosotalea sp.]|nr:dihydropteroate synthase [Candidatus Nitrosotalea sp.]
MSRLGPVRVGDSQPVRIMGIINASPESFYKKSVYTEGGEIARVVRGMEQDGADIIDVGGMSTAPYLRTLVSESKEIERVTKAISAIQKVSKLPISIDTCRAGVAKAAFELGVEILNDVTGLKFDKNMPRVVAEYGPSVILCAYGKERIAGSNVGQAKRLLRHSISIARKAGIPRDRIAVDPAIGFFRKRAEGIFFTRISSDWLRRDLDIMRNLKSFKMGYPLLVSVSRKSFIGKILGEDDPDKRLAGSLAAEAVAVLNGANIIRTHNVGSTIDVVKIAQELRHSKKGL